VIVHHAGGLHVGITNRAADKLESAPLQFAAHGLRCRRAGGNVRKVAPVILLRLSVAELPDEAVEAAERRLHFEKLPRVNYCGLHFQPVAHDARILQQRFYVISVVSGNAAGIEIIEGAAIVFALAQNGEPAQPGLGAFQNQEFEQAAVIVQRHGPFAVVIMLIQRIVAAPVAAAGHPGLPQSWT